MGFNPRKLEDQRREPRRRKPRTGARPMLKCSAVQRTRDESQALWDSRVSIFLRPYAFPRYRDLLGPRATVSLSMP